MDDGFVRLEIEIRRMTTTQSVQRPTRPIELMQMMQGGLTATAAWQIIDSVDQPKQPTATANTKIGMSRALVRIGR